MNTRQKRVALFMTSVGLSLFGGLNVFSSSAVSEKPSLDSMILPDKHESRKMTKLTQKVIPRSFKSPAQFTNFSEEADLKSLQLNETCNCSSTTTMCLFGCHRGILNVHKMGILLSRKIAQKDFVFPVDTFTIAGQYQNAANFGNEQKRDLFHDPLEFMSDYRHVVLTRNFYDAILSGYLYHKAHMECDRDWYGKRGHRGWLLNNSQEDWEARIREVPIIAGHGTWPAGLGRDLCTYLSDESEEDGLHVYMVWAKTLFLDPLISFARIRRQYETSANVNRTLFICYEQLIEQFTPTVKEMAKWIFPGHRQAARVHVKRKPARSAFGHATTADSDTKGRLFRIINNLDRMLFNGSLKSRGESEFGCGNPAEEQVT